MHIHFHAVSSRKLVMSTSILFMIGASCFVFSSVVFLFPNPNATVLNWIYFIGSIPFTSAAFLQLLDATNQKGQDWKLWAVRPQNRGYIAGLTQWIGTVLFNFNTFDATRNLTLLQEDFFIWTPNMLGSILFLVSAYYLCKEANFEFNLKHRENLSIWINMLGCITFMLSALTSVFLPTALPEFFGVFALVNTGLGAVCFFTAAAIGLTRLPQS